MYALDCEMVQTDREDSALMGLCLVDESGNAVFKALVKPRGTVIDYRTSITGLSAEDMEVGC
ncbi:hypothetical protein FOA52_003947 [Chlamydomonas sp. UWO 241]|nr:hypothetical protein FOA52_003947 [Chlamydomonas sp. UWO 241]